MAFFCMQLQVLCSLLIILLLMGHLSLWWYVINQLFGGLSPSSSHRNQPQYLKDWLRFHLPLAPLFVQRALFCLHTPKRTPCTGNHHDPFGVAEARGSYWTEEIKKAWASGVRESRKWRSLFKTGGLYQCPFIIASLCPGFASTVHNIPPCWMFWSSYCSFACTEGWTVLTTQWKWWT